MQKSLVVTALAVAIGAPAIASAQNADLDQIRRQIQELRDTYETRIKALEDQLKSAEAAARKAEEAARQATASATRAEESAQRTVEQAQPTAATAAQPAVSQNALNPGISLILNGSWGRYGKDATAQITGFHGSGASEIIGPGPSLGESELFLSSNIDPYFRGALLAALTPENEVEVEEAFVETTALGYGLTVKGGRFFSGLGYWNSVHPHAWDFTDASLVQRAFLGKNYGDDGVQLRWVAPLPVFVQLGAELGRGREFAGMGEIERNSNGKSSETFFVKVGGDLGDSHSWQVGASHLRQRTTTDGVTLFDYDDLTGLVNLFAGRQRITGGDFVWKWAPDGNPKYRNFKFVSEFYQRKLDGDFTFDTAGAASTDAMRAKQSGWFMQGVYQFHPYWRTGLRYDRLSAGTVSLNANAANLTPPGFDPNRWTVMMDYNPSEFSRIRLQFARDRSRQDIATGETIGDTIVFLQYVYSLGAHGAHRF
ncbi:MAG: hypothetical protein JNL33_07480 [Betaproteobacteria bacterium]|nr:hypothetical protein [Betaproteobacteria bacterium]